jgi:DNA repair protein RecN (Recombination protein N)
MLAGMDSTETGRAHAEELLAVAEADKKATRGKGRKKK